MIQYKNPDELIKNELYMSVISKIYPIIKIGNSAFKSIYDDYYNLFNSNYFKPIVSRIQAKTIYCQFEKNLLAKDFPFKCRMRKVNNFGEYIPELSRGGIFLHILPAHDNNSLPSFSEYKLESSYYNKFNEKQTLYDFSNESDYTIRDDKYYGIITFGGKASFEFVNLIIPSPGYKDILWNKSLKPELEVVKSDEEDKKEKKQGLVIRDYVLNSIFKKSEGNDDND